MFRKLSHVLLDMALALRKAVGAGTPEIRERFTTFMAGLIQPRPNALVPIRVTSPRRADPNRLRRG